MLITTDPAFINQYRNVSNLSEAENSILHIVLMAWGTHLDSIKVKMTLPNGVHNTFEYHRPDSLIDFAAQLLREAKKHL